jgi:molybdopterin-binding protein
VAQESDPADQVAITKYSGTNVDCTSVHVLFEAVTGCNLDPIWTRFIVIETKTGDIGTNQSFQEGGCAMKYGARNQLIGKVVEIKRGTVMSQIKFSSPADSSMSSVMTLESLDELGIKKGDTVRAVVKAVNVLLVKE